MSVPVPAHPVTLSMFWPLLLFASQGASRNVAAAMDAVWQRRGGTCADLTVDEVAEELARTHFPSGTTLRNVGWYTVRDQDGHDAGWATDCDVYETFLELTAGLERSGPLSPTDPIHVAMVARVLALSLRVTVHVEGPTVKVEAGDCTRDGVKEYGVWVRICRMRSTDGPVSAGMFFPGVAVVDADVGVLLFRWLVDRHAEVVQALEATETDPED